MYGCESVLLTMNKHNCNNYIKMVVVHPNCSKNQSKKFLVLSYSLHELCGKVSLNCAKYLHVFTLIEKKKFFIASIHVQYYQLKQNR